MERCLLVLGSVESNQRVSSDGLREDWQDNIHNYKCQDPCAGLSCPGNAPCVVEGHKPVCKFCPPGFIADPNYGCLEGTQSVLKPMLKNPNIKKKEEELTN